MNESLEKKIFLICPVRGVTDEEKEFLNNYLINLESTGYRVHYPPRDTNQDDPIGINICSQNRDAIKKADEIHIYWNSKSEGSLFDFGMAFMAEKPIRLINPEILQTDKKSFQNVLIALNKRYNLYFLPK